MSSELTGIVRLVATALRNNASTSDFDGPTWQVVATEDG